MIKSIVLNYHKAHTKEEKVVFGQTRADKNIAEVYINIANNRKSEDVVDTFFHEMAHVFFAFHNKKKKMSAATEERLAQQLGRISAEILR
jgi:hypothetical protein